MSQEITTAFVTQFKSNIILLSQQKGSRLRMAVRDDGEVVGEKVFFERIGATQAVRRTERHADTPLITTSHSRRMGTLYDYEWADLIDRQDRLRMLISPDSTYAQNASYALGRSIDDEIITALGGVSYNGKDGTTQVAFPTGQKVAEGSAGLTIGKLIEAREILSLADVDTDSDPLYIVVSPKQITNMLNSTPVTSADYNTVKALVKGEVKSFMGFEFIVSNRLKLTGDDRLCYAWAKSGMGVYVPADIQVRISERADKSYSTQVYASMSVGAVRVEDAKVVEIACDE